MPFVRVRGALCVFLTTIVVVAGGIAARSVEAQDTGAYEEASAASTTDRQRVGVVLLPRGEASSDMTDSLTELLIAAIAGRGATEIVGKEEFQAALGRDDAGTLACIESDACLGRMGRELRVNELVAGTLHRDPATAEHAERFRFELYRLDVESGSARGRVSREIDGGFGELLSALTASIDELYVERVEPGAVVVQTTPREASLAIDDSTLVPAVDGSFRQGFLVPGTHRLVARASGRQTIAREISIEPGTTLMLSLELAPRVERLVITAPTFALAGAGAASFAVGALLGALSSATPDPNQPALDMRQSHAFYEARATEALAANVLFAIGGACLIAAVVSLIVDLDAEEEEELLDHALRRGEIAWW